MGNFLSPEEIEQLRQEADLKRSAERNANIPVSRPLTTAMLISFAVALVGCIVGSIFGAEMFAAACAVQLGAVFGTGFFSGSYKKNIDSIISAWSFPLFLATGCFTILFGFWMLFLRKYGIFDEAQYQYIKGILVRFIFISGGAYQIFPTVYYRLMLKNRCTEPVSASCIGHFTVMLGKVNDHPVNGTAPIWEYFFDGCKYTVTDNIYIKKGRIPNIGEPEEILVDPKFPERILSPYGMPKFGVKTVIGAGLILFALLARFG